uniref:Coenzyme PQQ synthesis protein F-like C-terminal lobe domain-containing protein n=1 Tax=Amphiprion ocellaris TaxID=80972 RepID=A0AAQ5Y4K0_AMPOC
MSIRPSSTLESTCWKNNKQHPIGLNCSKVIQLFSNRELWTRPYGVLQYIYIYRWIHISTKIQSLVDISPTFEVLRFQYQVYPTYRNTLGVLGFSITVETWATKFSSEPVEAKIEDFLWSFGERLAALSEDAFNTQVAALIKPRECEDAHLWEEVDHSWFKVVTQKYLFSRLHKEVKTTHIHNRNTTDTQSVDPAAGASGSGFGSAVLSQTLKDMTLISDIRSFTSTLPLHPYHKILSRAPHLPQDPQ